MGNELAMKDRVLEQAQKQLAVLIQDNISAIPKSLNRTRFIQNCITVLKDTKGIEKCEPLSIARTMIKGAFLGLDFFNGECYAIPFGTELQFLTDYKGDIKLCRQYSIKPVKNIFAELVREGDDFSMEVIDGRQVVNFKPKMFSDAKVIGAFAVVYYDDESMNCAIMSADEIETTRKHWSKCPNSPAWTKAPGEMQKKTVLKRLAKFIVMNFDNENQDQAYADGGDMRTDVIDVQPSKQVSDPFTKPAGQEQAQLSQPAAGKKKGKEEGAVDKGDLQKDVLTLQAEIEDILKDKGQHPTAVYKYAKDFMKKELVDLSVEEMAQLKQKVAAL